MSKAMSWVTVLLLIGYVGFEVTHLKRFSYRMEPGYVLDEFVVANRAVELCGEVDEEERDRFLKNLAIMQRRVLTELEAADTSLAAAGAQQALDVLIERKSAEVDARVAAYGCDDRTVWRWLKLHEIRGRLNLVDLPAANTGRD